MAVPIRRRNRTEIEAWDPFQEFSALQDRMSRLFGELFPVTPHLTVLPTVPAGAWNPDIDVYETDKEVIVKAHVPGIDQKALDVTLDEDSISIRGELKQSEQEKTQDHYCCEIAYGAFSRTMPLPSLVQPDKAKAHLENGVLEVKAPKSARETARSKKVKIS